MYRIIDLCVIASLFFPCFTIKLSEAAGMNTNSDNILIQWNSEGALIKSFPAPVDLAVFSNGFVEVGPRFANGTVTRHQLSESDLAALRRFVFYEQDIWSIDSTAIDSAVEMAAKADADS